jgi:hypothetical protein
MVIVVMVRFFADAPNEYFIRDDLFRRSSCPAMQREYAFEREAITVKGIEEARKHKTFGKVSARPRTIAL